MITYLKGDATAPQGAGMKIIAHVCNDIGKWGSGFVVAVSKRWDAPEAYYRQWHKLGKLEGMALQNPMKGSFVATTDDFKLGEVQVIQVTDDVFVANMIGQEGVGMRTSGPPVRYPAIKKALYKVATFADIFKASIHMPRIGCGLAGGSWSQIRPLIESELGDRAVFVYDL